MCMAKLPIGILTVHQQWRLTQQRPMIAYAVCVHVCVRAWVFPVLWKQWHTYQLTLKTNVADLRQGRYSRWCRLTHTSHLQQHVKSLGPHFVRRRTGVPSSSQVASWWHHLGLSLSQSISWWCRHHDTTVNEKWQECLNVTKRHRNREDRGRGYFLHSLFLWHPICPYF